MINSLVCFFIFNVHFQEKMTIVYEKTHTVNNYKQDNVSFLCLFRTFLLKSFPSLIWLGWINIDAYIIMLVRKRL